MGFPAPPRPLKAPPRCLQGPPPPPNPNFATAFASGFFTSSAPCRPTGGEWDWGGGEQNKETKEPLSQARHPLCSLRPAGEQEGLRKGGTPGSRPQDTFPRLAARGRVGGGDCPRAADTTSRNRPEWPWAPAASTHWAPLFHQQFQKNLPKAVMPHCNV